MKVVTLARYCKKRLLEDKDLVIAITGGEGDGKSALGFDLCLNASVNFDLERNVLYSPTVEEAKNKIYSLEKYSPLWVDEAIKIMYKLNWGTKLTKYLNVVYAICRKQNLLTVLCMPRFTDFTEYFRNHRIKMWLHIFDPISNKKKYGTAALMLRSWNPAASDPWGLKDADKIYDKVKKGNYSNLFSKKSNYFGRLDSFVGFVEFNWVDEGLWLKYLTLKDKFSLPEELEDADELRDKELDKWRKRCLLATRVFLASGYSLDSVSRLYSVEKNTIRTWFKPVKKLVRIS